MENAKLRGEGTLSCTYSILKSLGGCRVSKYCAVPMAFHSPCLPARKQTSIAMARLPISSTAAPLQAFLPIPCTGRTSVLTADRVPGRKHAPILHARPHWQFHRQVDVCAACFVLYSCNRFDCYAENAYSITTLGATGWRRGLWDCPSGFSVSSNAPA